MNNLEICVAGAGLVGCVIARLLSDLGYRVSVYEKRGYNTNSGMSNGRSTHLVVSERGWKVFKSLGIESLVESNAIKLKGRYIHKKDGSSFLQDYSSTGECLSAIHRTKLNEILLNLIKPQANISVYFGKGVHDIDFYDNVVYFDAGDQKKFDLIIGADGSNSVVRNLLVEFGKVQTEEIVEPFSYKEIPISRMEAQGLDSESMHAWPYGGNSFFSFPNMDGSHTGTLISSTRDFESLRKNLQSQVTYFDKLEFIKEFNESFFTKVLSSKVSTLRSIICSRYDYGGKVLLMGDAGHSMLPFLGQGMNSGLEDCSVFIDKVNRFGIKGAVEKFTKARKRDLDAVTMMSRDMFTELTCDLSSPEYIAMKNIEKRCSTLFPNEFQEAYRMIAFSCMPYSDVKTKINFQNKVVREFCENNGFRTNYSDSDIVNNLGKVLSEA